MIKLIPVHIDNASLSPFVFAVAIATSQIIEATMQAFLTEDVLSNLLVAILTKPGLRFLVESQVTTLAFLLIFGVTLNYRTRHQYFFD